MGAVETGGLRTERVVLALQDKGVCVRIGHEGGRNFGAVTKQANPSC